MPKIVDREDRRRVFAEAAVEVIADKGLDALRLVDVARAVGVTTGSLGHYYDDKEELLDAALTHVIAKWDEKNRGIEGSLIDLCMQCLPIDADRTRAGRAWMILLTRSFFDKAMAKKLRRYYDGYHAALIRILGDLDGRSKAETEVIAANITAVTDGLMLRALTEPKRWPARRLREQLETALLELVGQSALE